MNITLDTWIISDTHFNHDNIIKYCGRPEDHTQIMQDKWFAKVAVDDTVLHLGDMMMGPKRDSETIMARLPGQKYYILGNHDKKTKTYYLNLGWKHVGNATASGTLIKNAVYFEDGANRVLLTHYPDETNLSKWTINIHGHIHNNGYSETTPADRDYRNVSIEVMNYEPVRLRDILYAGRFQNPRQAGRWTPNERD